MTSDLHCRCFAFEAEFTADLRCIPMAVRRKLDLVGIKLRLSHWHGLTDQERRDLLSWSDDDASLAAMAPWLLQRTATMAEGAARAMEPATHQPWQQSEQLPQALADSCQQLGLPLSSADWSRLDPLQRFALLKLSHPGHEHRNLPRALREFGLIP